MDRHTVKNNPLGSQWLPYEAGNHNGSNNPNRIAAVISRCNQTQFAFPVYQICGSGYIAIGNHYFYESISKEMGFNRPTKSFLVSRKCLIHEENEQLISPLVYSKIFKLYRHFHHRS